MTGADYYTWWNQVCRVTSDMEQAGCLFDRDRCLKAAERATADYLALLARWELVAPGVNPESPVQLVKLLYTARKMPVPPIQGTLKAVKRTKRGEFPTGEASLDWLWRKAQRPENKELLRVLMDLRKTAKLAQFLAKLPEFCDDRGFLYGAFGPDTGTARLSSRNPNLQQIPGAKNDKYGIRACFIAPPGMKLFVGDYSALEPRVLASWLVLLFGDYSLAEALATGDVYGAVAKNAWPDKTANIKATEFKGHPDAAISKMRDDAKIVFLAKVYGKGHPGMALQMNKTVGEAKQIDSDFLRAYPGILAFQEYALKQAQATGGVRGLLGLFRSIPNADSPEEYERARAARQASNTLCQQSAAMIVYGAMVRQEAPAKKLGATLQLSIHDELVLRTPDDVDPQPIVDAMERPLRLELPVPLIVDWHLCDNWSEGKG